MNLKATLAMILCTALSLSAVEMRVPAELVGKETIAVVDINIDVLNRAQFLKTITDIIGEAPSQEMQGHYDDFMAQFAAAGGATISIVLNMQKDMEYPADGLLLVIGPQPGADIAKLSDYMFSFAPEMKQTMAADCPKQIGGSLVWCQRSYKLPKADAGRYTAFARAYTQLPKNNSFTVVLLAEELAAEMIRSNLKPQEADRVDALMGGNGVCLFSNIGVVEKPALKLLVLTPDAAGAEKLSKVASALIGDLKEKLPAMFANSLDSLKVVEAGSNVQINIALPAVSKAAKDVMGSVATGPDAPGSK